MCSFHEAMARDRSSAGRFHRRGHKAPRGLTLLECMILLTILSIVGLGVGLALQASSNVPVATDRAGAISTELASEMDYWRALAWGGPPWPTTLPSNVADTVTMSVGGRSFTYNRTTNIQNWDPTNIAGNASPQSDFVRIQLTINGQVLTAYLARTF
jgi:type II secretory pathway pseudopilin PulG